MYKYKSIYIIIYINNNITFGIVHSWIDSIISTHASFRPLFSCQKLADQHITHSKPFNKTKFDVCHRVLENQPASTLGPTGYKLVSKPHCGPP